MLKLILTLLSAQLIILPVLYEKSTIIPETRLVDWSKAGNSQDISSERFNHIINITDLGASGDGVTDDTEAVKRAIDFAATLNGRVQIFFPSGKYLLTETIKIHGQNNLVLSGAGPGEGPGAVSHGTVLLFDDDIGDFHNNNDNFTSLIRISGWVSSTDGGKLTGYDSDTNTITVDNPGARIEKDGYVLIRPVHIGEEKKFLGQIVKVEDISGRKITLEDDFRLTWDDRGDLDFQIYVLNMVSGIGIENLSIERTGSYALNHNDYPGINIHFRYATESRVTNIYSDNPVSIHLNAHYSSRLEIKNNFFDDAQNHDGYGGGQGYGVSLTTYSTFCLVEDNIFRRLRSSMVVSYGANRNVFGYNYSREVTYTSGSGLGDLSIHGLYVYANLFEGNMVDRIRTDQYHAANGPGNTLLRNHTYYNDIVIEGSPKLNLIGNEGRLTNLGNSDNLIDFYGTKQGVLSGHTNWESSHHLSHSLEDVSYYRNQKPYFFGGLSWPAIGPPVAGAQETSQNIPARLRYCEANTEDCN